MLLCHTSPEMAIALLSHWYSSEIVLKDDMFYFKSGKEVPENRTMYLIFEKLKHNLPVKIEQLVMYNDFTLNPIPSVTSPRLPEDTRLFVLENPQPLHYHIAKMYGYHIYNPIIKGVVHLREGVFNKEQFFAFYDHIVETGEIPFVDIPMDSTENFNTKLRSSLKFYPKHGFEIVGNKFRCAYASLYNLVKKITEVHDYTDEGRSMNFFDLL